MDWWKEVSRMCLNFTVLTVGAFSYTTLTGRWNTAQCILGFVLAGIWFMASRLTWRKGGK
ncbi:MAG: hypothetical protein A3F84_18340 [Candidatus Handelsmanbacteria bacterium RIFCSPLOWO2_12_FULL_64_10]|uniref:Uncharacterized protein n=1 Tax=Handelsmanbacteria sp. (strain RIFCSPLOWO2_12_FULL_64_10) TaxID=1817868 RepID=A0A1F6C4N3_HANXR|nr:MAG: hypothetical protein A3F84_18340 [Candidatus Handelsmanbacteria bacterium RIFCSPLOWO2_12_FULL_64_10]